MSKYIIQTNNVSYRYNNYYLALNDISFNVIENEWLSIIGPNGSGKSTLVNLIDGLFNLKSGSIVIDGIKLNKNNIVNIRRNIGIVFQNPVDQFVSNTVEDDIAFGLENLNVSQNHMNFKIDNALKEVNMLSFKHSSINELSGGQQQKIAIAGIIAIRPKIIILDESLSMLDPVERYNILNMIKYLKDKHNITIISITHDINELRYSDRIIVLNNGKILNQDIPKNVLNNEHQLLNIGLDIPYTSKLKNELYNNNIKVPSRYMSEKEMLDWIMQFN